MAVRPARRVLPMLRIVYVYAVLGQLRSVESIARAADALFLEHPTGGTVGAKLPHKIEDGTGSRARDGRKFQVVSWRAAHCRDDDALVRAA